MTVGWLDCSSGVSGDMLLGALDGAGVDLAPALVALAPLLGPTGVEVVDTSRAGVAARRLRVTPAPDPPPLRTLPDLRRAVTDAAVPEPVRAAAVRVLERLADAEAAVHGTTRDAVHFHEVGAVDTVLDVVGVCFGLHQLALDRLVVSPIALGGGSVATEHGRLPVPGPAVLGLLAGCDLTAAGGPLEVELATPTGVALLAELSDGSGAMPAMTVDRVGMGAGTRELADRPNIVRLVVGQPAATGEDWVVVEANVDDLDPRLWPEVLHALMAAGAADAWLTPIVMKKGRPAHTVAALTASSTAEPVATALFLHTTTLGVRTTAVAKRALQRSWVVVDVDGQQVRVKRGHLDGAVVNAVPEFDDVVAAAAALKRPAKLVLTAAAAAARELR